MKIFKKKKKWRIYVYGYDSTKKNSWDCSVISMRCNGAHVILGKPIILKICIILVTFKPKYAWTTSQNLIVEKTTENLWLPPTIMLKCSRVRLVVKFH